MEKNINSNCEELNSKSRLKEIISYKCKNIHEKLLILKGMLIGALMCLFYIILAILIKFILGWLIL